MTRPAVVRIGRSDKRFPCTLLDGPSFTDSVEVIGTPDLLSRVDVAIVSSTRLPGAILLAVYDLLQRVRLLELTLASGFHSPMERQCLEILLTGRAGVVVLPARSIARFRIPLPWRPGIEEGRLTVLSAFPDTSRRSTRALAAARNRVAACLAESVFIPYAHPGGETERLARELCSAGKPVRTLHRPENDKLLTLGARPWAL
jgi:predicted Rossmann fold nucleotide-binding protein DprA/Smf involved in DNA uptake